MFRLPLAAALAAVLALGACTQAPDSLAGPTVIPGLPGTSGNGGITNPGDTTSGTPGDTTHAPIDTAAAGDPEHNGTWTPADSTSPPIILPVDPTAYDPAGSGSAGSSGSSTVLI